MQRDQLKKIILLLYNDEELKRLMAIPDKDFNNLLVFRDMYCIAGYGTYKEVSDDLPSRLLIYWDDMTDTTNRMVKLRPLMIEIWVQTSRVYGVTKNALDRRHDLIADRIKYLLTKQRIEGFNFEFTDMGDLHSNTQDYIRSFMEFTVKYIK